MTTATNVLPLVPGLGDLLTAVRSGQLSSRQATALDALLVALVEPSEEPPAPAVRPVDVDNGIVIARYLRAGAARGWRAETTRLRTLQLRKIADAMPVPLVEMTEDHVVAWAEALTGKPETISSYISALRGLTRWMSTKARPRIRLDDPAAIIDRPRIPTAAPRPIASDAYDLALACAVSDPEMYVWLGLMGCSGLRCCEVAWMVGPDVEPLEDGGGLLHIVGKGGKRRTVPAGPHLMTVLGPFVERAGTGPVFPRASGGARTPKAVSQRVTRFLRDLRIPATAHQLRHRWAGDYHALDPDLYRQAKLMGHASVETTQRYTEVSPTEAARYVTALTRRRLGPGATPRSLCST